jgi:cyclopropane fatty-acyl-phospholipid synthase-like methyltransferase
MIIENEKDDCVQSIVFGLNRTANWRDKVFERYQDQRNVWASSALKKLAGDAPGLSEDSWSQLQPHYDWGSPHWREAISAAARQVGFQHKSKSFAFFVKNLIGALSQPSVVN